MRKIAITSEFITLGQFLKFVGIVDNGGQAKAFIFANDILVNGEKEIRRGRKLRPGNVISIGKENYQISENGS